MEMFMQEIAIENWTATALLTIWSVAQSLILEYVPYISEWYEKLEKKWKRFVQAAGLFVVSAAVFGLACGDIIGGIECNQAGVIEMLLVWIWALMANQTTHALIKKDN
jgi:O-antigen/teichoic acid export membrane protein